MNTNDQFEHRDLTRTNIMIYKLDAYGSNYVTMNYIYPDKTSVTFNTFGIVKIIDCARSFFKDTTDPNASKDNFLNIAEKKTECGNKFDIFVRKNETYPELDDLFNVKFMAQYLYGTPVGTSFSNSNPTLNYPNKTKTYIPTVQEMHIALKNYVQQNEQFKAFNKNLFNRPGATTKIGTITIYVDGSQPFAFTPV